MQGMLRKFSHHAFAKLDGAEWASSTKQSRSRFSEPLPSKFSHWRRLVDPKALQRFKNEVTAIATLEHPHIVSVYSVGEERGIHYFAMRFVRGQSLGRRDSRNAKTSRKTIGIDYRGVAEPDRLGYG